MSPRGSSRSGAGRRWRRGPVRLARRAGVNRVSIARIEAGHQLPRYSTLVALVKALDVPLDQLLMG
ncbi:MAG: helix-turn-helix transcriptional regulator [Longimicrobiales bacterium]|nr:helix-turn-helix transcriptional regulator [Longimicrobiales bacterium]